MESVESGDSLSEKITLNVSEIKKNLHDIKILTEQGTLICASYIKNRLKRSGIFHRKLGFKRIRRMIPNYEAISDVSHILIEIGIELENTKPSLFIGVARQIGYGIFSTEQSVLEGMTAVAREMFNHGEISWMKIVSFMAVTGGIAVDCARQGHYNYIPVIQRFMISILEEDIAPWVQINGGWETAILKYRPQSPEKSLNTVTCVWTSIIILMLATVIWLIRHTF